MAQLGPRAEQVELAVKVIMDTRQALPMEASVSSIIRDAFEALPTEQEMFVAAAVLGSKQFGLYSHCIAADFELAIKVCPSGSVVLDQRRAYAEHILLSTGAS